MNFAALPKDLLAEVLKNWVGEEGWIGDRAVLLKSLCALDIAYCSQSLRPIWLDALSSLEIDVDQYSVHQGDILKWVFSRNVSVSHICVPVVLFSHCEYDWFSSATVRSVELYYNDATLPASGVVRQLLASFPALSKLRVSLVCTERDSQAQLLQLADNADVRLQTLEVCGAAISDEAV